MPYRTERPRREDEGVDHLPRSDDLILAALLFFIGGLRVIIAVADHEVFADEATIALLMVAFAVVLLNARTGPPR